MLSSYSVYPFPFPFLLSFLFPHMARVFVCLNSRVSRTLLILPVFHGYGGFIWFFQFSEIKCCIFIVLHSVFVFLLFPAHWLFNFVGWCALNFLHAFSRKLKFVKMFITLHKAG